MRRVLLLACCLLAGCKQLFGLDDPTQATPIDAAPDGGVCSAASSTCIGDVLRTCTAPGQEAIDTTCTWGCGSSSTTPGIHCLKLQPTGGGARPSDLEPSDQLVAVTLADNVVINTSTGEIGTAMNPGKVRGAGQGIISGIEYAVRDGVGVFRVAKLTVAGQVTVGGDRSFVLVSIDDIVLGGLIDARGPCTSRIAGPGGYRGGDHGQDGSGPGGGRASPTLRTGGGGGGYGGTGGSALSAAGGATYGDAAITKLFGGAGGAGASGGGGNSGVGGGGGGAVQLVSNTLISISGSGGINAGGCGGTSGGGSLDPGGGGGAGGTIVLEAPRISIAGTLAVNGGAGGAGAAGVLTASESGRLDRTQAMSVAAGELGGPGGAGATFAGGPAAPDGGGLGGGGGAVGRIRLTTRAMQGLSVQAQAVLSPSYSDPASTCTHGASVVD